MLLQCDPARYIIPHETKSNILCVSCVIGKMEWSITPLYKNNSQENAQRTSARSNETKRSVQYGKGEARMLSKEIESVAT